MTVALEICVEGPEGARAAFAGGADRIELCAALALGGLTPSPGLVATTLEVGLPVHALIRPFAGDFVYGPELVEAVARDIRTLSALGVAGVVVGALTPDRRLDHEALARWRDGASGIAMTLHRAIDLCGDPVDACRAAAALGIDRILTSGGARTAPEGAETIAAMVAAADGGIEIMAGSGITADTVRTLIAATGVTAVHASAATKAAWEDRRIEGFGFGPTDDRRTDPALVRSIATEMARP